LFGDVFFVVEIPLSSLTPRGQVRALNYCKKIESVSQAFVDLWRHHIDVNFLYTDLTDNASFDKVKFWVDQLKAAEPVSCLKW